MKKVSIVTPVYKLEKYIGDCIQSVIKQTYPSIEFVLVDDCGGDKSVDIINDFISSTHKEGLEIKLIHHEHNQGVAAARSHAMQAATGDYIFCLDSDDMLKPECIDHLVKRMEETDADFVVCDHYSDKENEGLGGHLCTPVDVLEGNEACIHALAECWFNVAPWCKLLKRSFIEQNQLYFCDGILNEDAPWTFQLCLNASKIAFLAEELYYYRYNGHSIMSDSKKRLINESNMIALQIFHDEIVKRPDLWENKDIYILFMRQIVIYYTMTAKQFGFRFYMKKIKLLSSFYYESSWFKRSDIPVSYKIWNHAFCMPRIQTWVMTYLLIKGQSLKK